MTIQQDIAALTQSVDAMTAAVVEDATTRQQAVSDAQAAAGAAAGAVADALGERTVATSGLATGGGTLGQDLTISVPKASEAEAEAGEADNVVLTPALMKRALAALLGGTPIPLPGSPVQRTVGEVLGEVREAVFPRATAETDFSELPVGQGIPEGWAERWDLGATWSILEDATAIGGKLLRCAATENGRRLLTKNDVPDGQNVEVLFRAKIAAGAQMSARARVTDFSPTSEDGVYFSVNGNDNTAGIFELVAGNLAVRASVAFTPVPGRFYWIRGTLNGANASLKVWSGPLEDEPATDLVTATTIANLKAGKVGVGTFIGTTDFDYFAAKSDGTAATLSPIATKANIVGDYDGGLVNHLASSVARPQTVSPDVVLLMRGQPSERYASGTDAIFWHWGGMVTGVKGKVPSFKAILDNGIHPPFWLNKEGDPPDSGLPTDQPGWVYRPWYSYDQETWFRFDNLTETGAGTTDYFCRFSNNSAFTGDTVYVRYMPGHPVGLVTKRVAALSGNPLVSPTSSAVSGSGADRFRIGTVSSRVDDMGRRIPAQPVYGFKISNGAALATDGAAKRKALLTSGVHPCEQEGQWTIWGLIDWLLGGSAEAGQALARYDFYVYPCVNPVGVYGGHWRGTFDPVWPQPDANRHWDKSDLECINLHKTAILADVGASAHVVVDFHSPFYRTHDALYGAETTAGTVGADWVAALTNSLTAMGVTPRVTVRPWPGDITAPAGSTEGWARANLSPRFAISSESGPYYVTSTQDFAKYGEAHGRALIRIFNNGHVAA
jgi:hypothetical protein